MCKDHDCEATTLIMCEKRDSGHVKLANGVSIIRLDSAVKDMVGW